MAPNKLIEEIRSMLKNEKLDHAAILQRMEGRGNDKDESERELQKLVESGDIIEVYDKSRLTLCLTEELRESCRPIILRPRLDLSRRIIETLFKHRKLKEIEREELKNIMRRVHNIVNFNPKEFAVYFDYGLKQALKTDRMIVEGSKCRLTGTKLPLICSICANQASDSHERKLECIHCRSQRHASCMGLRKHKLHGDFECELCAPCSSCSQQPTPSHPLAWCPVCYKPKHVRGCGRSKERIGAAAVAALPTVHLCVDCGGKPVTVACEETEPSTSSASHAMATPGPEKGVVGKLNDSLSAYFTPSCEGRRRHRPINTHEDSTSEEDNDVHAHMRPLTVEVAGHAEGIAGKTPPSSSSSTHRRAEQQLHDALSPYFAAGTGKRRSMVKGEFARLNGGGGGAMMEAGLLSPGGGGAAGPSTGGVQPSPKRGRGRPPRSASLIGSPPSSSAREEEEAEEGEEEEEERRSEGGDRRKMTGGSARKANGGSSSKKNRGGDEEEWRMGQGRATQNSASAALFSSPDEEKRRRKKEKGGGGRGESGNDSSPRRSKMTPSHSSSHHRPSTSATTPKSPSQKRIKREPKSSEEDTSQADSTDSDDKPLMRRGAPRTPSTHAAAAAMMTPSTSTAGGAAEKKSSKKRKDEQSKNGVKERIKAQSPIESTGTGAGSSIATNGGEMWGDLLIPAETWAMYEACTHKANESVEKTELLSADGSEIPRWPETICFGEYEMETWFTAPYPNEYANTKRLFICEFCLKYMRTLNQLIGHSKKCEMWHPPGNEVYRKDGVSVFEVDGNVAGIYCQNLCLLAKLYLDHKTLYYDVEPFLFYIVTKNDEKGCHFVGYFSKEKYSAQKFNLSCIVTLPCYHKQGFGRFLIDFSYLLTRREKMVGTPERPLSDLGRVSYAAYWRSALLEYMRKKIKVEKRKEFKLAEVAADTGISLYDTVEVLEALGMLVKSENSGAVEFIYKEDLVEGHWKKAIGNKERIWIDENALKWSPTAHTPSKDFASVRSPPRVVSPTPSTSHGVTPTGVPVAACGSTIKRGALAAANAGAGAAAAVAAAAAAGSSSTPRKAPQSSRANDKKRGAIRQLKLTDIGFVSSPKSTSAPARKSRRIAAASEDSSLASTSSDEDDKKKSKTDSKTTCKTDSTRRRTRRSEDSDDSSDEEKDGGGGATPKKRPTAPPSASAAAAAGRRSSGAARGGAAAGSKSPQKGGKKRGTRKDSDDDEEGEVSSAYETSSSDESDSDDESPYRPNGLAPSNRRPSAPNKGKKGGKGKPSAPVPKKGKNVPQKPGKGKKNGVTTTTNSQPVMANERKKELKSPGKVFPPNYLKSIAAARQLHPEPAEAAIAAAHDLAAAADSSSAAAAAAEDARPASPADSLCSTATIPMRQAPEAADQSMMTDDAHESEGTHTPGPSASTRSSRPSSSVVKSGGSRKGMEKRRNGEKTRREQSSDDEMTDSSIGGSSSDSSIFRGVSPRPIGDRVPSTSGGTMNMGFEPEDDQEEEEKDEEMEEDADRTMRMEIGEGGPPASSSSSERPPSLQAMSPLEREPEEAPPTLGSLLSHEMAKDGLDVRAGGSGSSSAASMLQLSQPRKSSAAAAAGTPLLQIMNGLGESKPCGSRDEQMQPLAACSPDDSEDDAPPRLSPQYGGGECADEDFPAAGCGSSNEDGAASDASAAPVLAPSNVARSISLDHTVAAVAGCSSSSNNGMISRRISVAATEHQSCAAANAAAAATAYDIFNTPPKAPLPHADQLLSQRPMDGGISHQELNFGMAPHSLHGRLSGGEACPGPPQLPPLAASVAAAQTSPLLRQQTTPIMQQQHSSQMMTYPGSASGGGMQSTPGSVSSAHNTPEMLQQQPQQMQQFMSPPMQQMYSQQPSSVHSTHSGHHDLSGGGGPGSVPPGSYGQPMMQAGHSNPSTPLRGTMPSGGPASCHQATFNSPPSAQPMSVPDLQGCGAAVAAASTSAAGRRSSEAASVGPAPAAAAATKKRSSTGGTAPPPALPSPLAAQQQQQQAQHQQLLQQAQMQQAAAAAMMQQQFNMQMTYPMYQYNPAAAYGNSYFPAASTGWTAAASAQFQQHLYPGMLQTGGGGVKNGAAMAAAAAQMPAAAAAAAASFYQYPTQAAAAAMQQQQHQMAQRNSAPAPMAAQWPRNPAVGPPFPGAGAAPDASAFMLNGGAMPNYFPQAAQPFTYGVTRNE